MPSRSQEVRGFVVGFEYCATLGPILQAGGKRRFTSAHEKPNFDLHN